MNKLRKLFSLLCALMALSASAQCRYCLSYEDLEEGRWVSVDTIYCERIGKLKKFWAGGNDYYMTASGYDLNQKVVNDAFAVMRGDTLYVNCVKLNCPGVFHNKPGYVEAKYMGRRGLLFVAPIVTDAPFKNSATVAAATTAVGMGVFALTGVGFYAVPLHTNNSKWPVCYLISRSHNENEDFRLRRIDDRVMSLLVFDCEGISEEYYSQKNKEKRHLAKHIVPILERSGLFVPVPDASEETEETN